MIMCRAFEGHTDMKEKISFLVKKVIIILILAEFVQCNYPSNLRTPAQFQKPNSLEQVPLLPCCQFQNSFQNGSCRKNTGQEFPHWFRNWTQATNFSCALRDLKEDLVQIQRFAQFNGFVLRIEEDGIYRQPDYCISSVGEGSVKLITCNVSAPLKCESRNTCTKKCCPHSSYLSINEQSRGISGTTDNLRFRCTSDEEMVIGPSYDYKKRNHNNSRPSILGYAMDYIDFHHRPKCENISYIFSNEFNIIEDGSSIILSGKTHVQTPIWLSLDEDAFCVDRLLQGNDQRPVLAFCKDDLQKELEKIQTLLKSILQDKFADAAEWTGVISIISSIFLSFALIIYILLWREHNSHGWIQFSFLLALFCTYFVAGLRRLIGYEILVQYGLAPFFEALEDFGAVSASANLVALSFDLFFLLWKSTPTFNKTEGWKQSAFAIILAWITGVIVMAAGLIIRSEKKYTILPSELNNLKEYLPTLLEFFLCIQNDMLFSICLPIVQLGLFSLNLILFLASAVVLYRRKVETQLAYENFTRSKVFKFWVRRFAKLFLLMGLWWPMIVVCLFECNDMLKYTTQVWTQVLGTFYKKPEKVDFEIPWHMYLISNLLAIQAIVTSVLFVCNRKTWNAMIKTWPIVRLCYEDIE